LPKLTADSTTQTTFYLIILSLKTCLIFEWIHLQQLPFLQHRLFSNKTPINNSERSCPGSHELNSQTSPHNLCPKITPLAKNPLTHPLQNSISYLQYFFNPLNPLTFANFSPSNHPGLLAHHHIFSCLALQSHPL